MAVLLPAVLLPVGALSSACSSDDTVEGEAPPTEIAVDPLEFLGDLPCSEDDGAARSYVAAITDEDEGFDLGASPPAVCSARVGFRHVIIGHAYTAEVDVYDRPATELTPAGGVGSGSRVMLDASGAVVAPRWRTRCGGGASGPAVAVDDTSVVVAGCDPLDGAGTGTTSLVVDTADALGSLACAGEEGGEVDTIRVVAEGSELPTVTVACGGAAVTYDEGIEGDTTYRFRLEGLDGGSDEVRWGAECVVVAIEGVARRAACEPLSDAGVLLVSTDALEEPGFACGLDYDTFDVVLEGSISVAVPRTACDREARLGPVPAGTYEGTLRTFESGTNGEPDQVERTARCEVEVAPGATAIVDCSFE